MNLRHVNQRITYKDGYFSLFRYTNYLFVLAKNPLSTDSIQSI